MCIKRRQYTQGKISQKEGEKSIRHVVNKWLLCEVINLQRQPAILCNNNAKYCYDRIVQLMTSMEMQRLGMPVQPMKCMLGTFQDPEQHIRTAHGTLESFMHNNQPINFQGMCQKWIRPNYLGHCKCTTNWNDESIREWDKIWSTTVPRQIQTSGICIFLQHQNRGRIFNKDWNNYWRRLHWHEEIH